MAYCCASYFFNYLDRAAFANVYVAALKEDLNLVGNNYSILLSLFTAGNLVGQIPHALIIHKVQPMIWLPTTLLVWSALTMCCAACTNYSQLAAMRFLQGLFEVILWSGTMYVIGSWYRQSKIAKRTSLFAAIGQLGSMFAGITMTAVRTTLHGTNEMKDWQWVFIIDGAMGLPIGIFGLLFFPNLPETTKAMYLSKEEVELVVKRMPANAENSHSRRPSHANQEGSEAACCLRTYHVFNTFCSAGRLRIPVDQQQGCFLLYLKHFAKPYPTTAPNTYPLGIQAVSIVDMILAGVYIDITGRRVPTGLICCGLQLISAIILVIPPSLSTPGAVSSAFCISGTSFIVNPILYGWASIILQRQGDDAARSVVMYTMNNGGQLLYTWWGIVMYPATDAPYWRKGAIALIVASCLFPASLWAMNWRTSTPGESQYLPAEASTTGFETEKTVSVNAGATEILSEVKA